MLEGWEEYEEGRGGGMKAKKRLSFTNKSATIMRKGWKN